MAHRTLSFLSLWLLTGLVSFYVVVRLVSGVVELRSWSSGLVLEETQPIVRFVEEGSAAQQAGLEPGDELFQPDGSPLKSFRDYAYWRRIAEYTKILPLVVKKRDGQFYHVEIRLLPQSNSWFSLGFFFAVETALIVVLCAGVGLAVCWLRWQDTTARFGGLFFISLSTLFGSSQSVLLPPWVSIPAGLLQIIGSSAVGYLSLCFFLEFPTPIRFTKAARFLRQCYGWIALFLGLLRVANFSARLTSFEAVSWFHSLPLVSELLSAHLIILWVGLASPFGFYFDRRRTQTPEQARRLKVFTLGSALGVIPALLLILAVSTFKFEVADYPWLYVLPIALFPLFPLSFAYVVVKHRVLGIQQILRSSVQYLFVSRGVVVVECLIFYFLARYLIFPLILWGHALTGEQPTPFGLRLWVVATGGTFFGLAIYVNPRLQKVIDRRFFREAYKVQQVLSDLATSIRQANNTDEMLRRVAATVDAALHVKTIGFLLHPSLLGNLTATGNNGNSPALRGFACRFGPNTSSTVESELYFPLSSPLITRLRQKPEPFDLEPESTDGIPYGQHPTLRRLESHLLVPLVSGDNLLGVFSLGPKLSEEPYTTEDKGLLMAVAESVALRLDNAQLVRRLTAEATLRRELEIARDMQQRLLPSKPPKLPGLDVAGVSFPANDVGGDYYDFVLLDTHRLAVAVGDVAGHGISSGLLMALAKGGLYNQTRSDAHPSAVMAALNQLIAASGSRRDLMTLSYAVIDTATQSIALASAGHPPVYHYRAETSTVEVIEHGAYPLGVRRYGHYPTQYVTYHSGDTVVFYTDGLIEARNVRGETFGFERLERLLAHHGNGSAAALQAILLSELRAFLGELTAEDDVTLVIIHFT
ncbi:MAG: SpoIIE family protein phosphatase [Acidobacteriota bacterium]